MTLRSRQFLCVCVLLLTAGVAVRATDAERIPDSEFPGLITSRAATSYPLVARQLKLEGTVTVTVTVGPSGVVEHAELVTGNPVLGHAAVAAARQFKFKPGAGRRVGNVKFDFHL